MRILSSIVAIALMATSALAQTPEQYTITVTPAELDAIGTLLGKQPYENVYILVGKIQAQVNLQRNAAKAPAAPGLQRPPSMQPAPPNDDNPMMPPMPPAAPNEGPRP